MSIFQPISADLDENGLTEIESCCMSCYKQGITRLMLTKIPFYRDVIISSFRCEHCHVNNTSIESANKIQEMGTRIKLLVEEKSDLNRELVKSDYATLTIPKVDFEIPAMSQKGTLTTVEGVLDRTVSNLETDVKLRMETDPETAGRIQEFVQKLNDLKSFASGPFELVR